MDFEIETETKKQKRWKETATFVREFDGLESVSRQSAVVSGSVSCFQFELL